MQTAQETGTFQRLRAEVPHAAVAIAPTNAGLEGGTQGTMAQEDELASLVERAKAGDGASLDDLLTALRPRAMATAMKVLRSSADAEDAVQEAFVKIWRSFGRFEGRSSFSTWVHRIVMNASLDLLRRNRPEAPARVDRQPEAAAEVEQDSERTPESDFAAHEMQLLVRSAIAALPQAHRQAVELRELDDCSYQEMADILGCPIGTVMSRLYHARHRLACDLRAPVADSFALAAA